jgi:hypothetical protein
VTYSQDYFLVFAHASSDNYNSLLISVLAKDGVQVLIKKYEKS